MRTYILSLLIAGCALTASVQAGEFSVFGSPSRGMVGAGIALMRSPTEQMYLNPAAVAYVRGFQLGVNNFGLDTENITPRQLQDTLKIGQKGAVDIADAARIIRTFGDEEKVRAVLSGDVGFAVNGFALTFGGVGDFRLHPNENLRRWVRGESDDLSGARGDLYGVFAFSLPELALGFRVSTNGEDTDELALGMRVRFLRVFYTHYLAQGEDISGGQDVSRYRALELGNRDYLEGRGTAIDFGVIYKPNREMPLSYALVVENLFEPNIEFAYTPPGGGPLSSIKPIKRAIHLGVALETERGLTYVADWVDVTNNTGRRELRFGAEQRLGRGLAVRAGYGSRNGWALGAEVLGVNFAIAQKFPMQISRSITF